MDLEATVIELSIDYLRYSWLPTRRAGLSRRRRVKVRSVTAQDLAFSLVAEPGIGGDSYAKLHAAIRAWGARVAKGDGSWQSFWGCSGGEFFS